MLGKFFSIQDKLLSVTQNIQQTHTQKINLCVRSEFAFAGARSMLTNKYAMSNRVEYGFRLERNRW